jgi:hypothetical protein
MIFSLNIFQNCFLNLNVQNFGQFSILNIFELSTFLKCEHFSVFNFEHFLILNNFQIYLLKPKMFSNLKVFKSITIFENKRKRRIIQRSPLPGLAQQGMHAGGEYEHPSVPVCHQCNRSIVPQTPS